MRVFSMLVAFLAALVGAWCVTMVSRFRGIYGEMFADGADVLPAATVWLMGTNGWVPGGVFLFCTLALVVLLIGKRDQLAVVVSLLTLLVMLATAVVLPALLLEPMGEIMAGLEVSPVTPKKL
ncbi:hypothetical protein [Sulfuriroseicoccus oceanibius]|uniref:Uncharacterized protein n=1 Tax=Sulfuriroseicoccus oceanibius TaxID=2707525 RepID=A0A6B3L2H8_9BACT|nr:hypothetical protein [Sulfuriroseicoccus oceanibius]QQL43900.1 hypothetical protein G3M56_008320 [Sulfuriroseicoccus oceanibius]